jgi:hypothetical protein
MSEGAGFLMGVYWLIGVILMVSLSRHLNRGLSLLDIACCMVAAPVWPVIAIALLVVAIALRAPWITEVRYFKKL